MKIRAGDIIRHKDGELYIVTADATTGELSDIIVELSKCTSNRAAYWVEGVKKDSWPDMLTHTGINICDILKECK